MTADEFIQKAKAKFGDQFDYSHVEFKNRNTPVRIVCAKHGEFTRTPAEFLRSPVGCPKCGDERRWSPEANRKRADHMMATNMKRYGVRSTAQISEVRAKQVATLQERLGVDNPQKAASVKAKTAATNQKRYGGNAPIASEAVREKMRETCRQRFGVDNPMQNEEVRARQMATACATRQERYGSDWYPSSEDYKRRHDEILERMQATCMERYNAPSYIQSAAYRERLDEIRVRKDATRKANGTFPSSVAEDELAEMLYAVFGKDNVGRNYVDAERYPFACDFYIKSRDLFIELNATWFHRDHWFDENDAEDCAYVDYCRQRSDDLTNIHSCWYEIYQTWARRDVMKREAARKHNLKYVVFWDDELADAWKWFDLGCPDGYDWKREYSWDL